MAETEKSNTESQDFSPVLVMLLFATPCRKKKWCQYEDPIGMGSSKLPITLDKMADFGE